MLVEEVAGVRSEVEDIESVGVRACDVLDKAVDDGFGKWIVEVEQTGVVGEDEVGGVLTEDAGGTGGVSGGLPGVEVVGGDLGQGGIEFDADYLLKRELRG